MAAADNHGAGQYSFIDRMLHRMAFAHPVVQRALGEIESDIFSSRFASQEIEKPVFVTGLPRAGTTLLLEMLYSTGEFATFTYREMPFVLAPLLWSSLTSASRKEATLRERAHGDGMDISFDSPEAFEEVAWLAYLRGRYVLDDRLLPIGPDALTAEFREAFPKLIRKLLANYAERAGARRYLSKNNANISRILALRSMFPDATIFVALREPVSHVRSLMTQHARFLSMHEADRFSRSYMEWIGHYDFGANFRPIDFAGSGRANAGADKADFWLRYWIDAYAFAESHAQAGVEFVRYESLFADAAAALSRIAEAAGLRDDRAFLANASRIRPPTSGTGALEGADPVLLDEARRLHDRIAARTR